MIHILIIAMYIWMAAQPAESAQGSVTLLRGDDNRETLRLDALAVKDWGLVYGRVDVASFDDDNASVFTRGIGHYGRGLHLAGQIQNQKGVSQTSGGFGYSDFTKDTSWFADIYRMSSSYYGDSTYAFVYGSQRFDKIKLSGFIEHVVPQKTYSKITLSQIMLGYELSPTLYAGVEYQQYFNKGGVKGADEVVNRVYLKWEF